MPSWESLQYSSLIVTHAATRPNHQTTPLSLVEWAWQNSLISFAEMLGIIDWLKETGQLGVMA